jgi:FKBP-type peptidyl-prolyl cis-trans isomerase
MKEKRVKLFISLLAISMVVLIGACDKETGLEKENAAIQAYLDENNITTEPQYSGLYFIETKKGTGASADGGDLCKVKYMGTFLDGEEFDSGVYEFTLGIGKVIQGWDEGISYMNEGGKATLLIPSSLGYKATGSSSGSIPGYTPLLFEVELIDVN